MLYLICLSPPRVNLVPVSGAHMNPAVTVAFLVTRQVGLVKGLFYIMVQFVGGFTAVLLLHGFLPLQIQGKLGYTSPSSLVTYHQAFGMELLTTFLFVFAFLASTDKHRGLPKSQALQIGLAYCLVTLWGFSFTGANMNPVRTVAPAIVLNVPDSLWLPILEIYIAGPLLGSIASALIYRYIFNMHRESLDVTESHQGSSIYDPEMDPNLVTLQRITPYRGKMVSEM
ncbi:putative aquaporin AQPAn.G [Apostichopus japonicus]|uniref:Putative aquaporin AQPAn.G n=1 Tax=Stichopus japonicus TaxID=307972 RepID=A0A2G8JUF6_STIJA|nr:putative aquaporin AQPAn.G [Apostichopus japonicus]